MSRINTGRQGLALAACALFALAACQPVPPMRVGAHVWPGYEFMYLAQAEGWLPPGRVAFFDTHTASGSLEGLRSGRLDAAALTLDEVLLGRAEGIDLTVVLVFDVSVGADKLLARPEVTDLAGLRGRRIGVETSALGELVLFHALASAGLSRDEVIVQPIDGRHEQAWRDASLALDALVTYEPTASRLEAEGLGVLFDSSVMQDSIVDVLAVRTEMLERHHASIEALARGHFRGLQALRSNQQDTAYRLASRLGMTGHEVLSVYRGLRLPNLAANRQYLHPVDGHLRKVAQEMAAWMVATGRLQQPDTLRDLVSDHWVRFELAP